MWLLLCLTTILIYCALPLSGLTMNIATVQTYSDSLATIYGPNTSDYNFRSSLPMQQKIRTNWQSGRQTSPLHDTILYAPQGIYNVSSTYFDDMINLYKEQVEFFAGPADKTPVSGRAWGLHAIIACAPTTKQHFRLLDVVGFEFAVQECRGGLTGNNCSLSDYKNATIVQTANTSGEVKFPFWLNGAGTSGSNTSFAYVVAADGFPGLGGQALPSPLTSNTSHDNLTLDHVENRVPQDEVTTGLFELYLWEYIGFGDTVIPALISNSTDGVNVLPSPDGGTFAGIAVQCSVKTAAGHAQLDPMHRTFSSFQRFAALSNLVRNVINILTWNLFPQGLIDDLATPQVFAAATLINGNQSIADTDLTTTDTANSNDGIWAALHNAIGSAPMTPAFGNQAWGNNGPGWAWYSGLRPRDLQLATYKLLGESIIALMDEGGTAAWKGELHSLRSTTYLVQDVLSWICVMVLLSIWALVLCFGAIWTAFFAGPRWAPTLDGYEMFKFGAQYTEEVNELESAEFRESADKLIRIPGMVGMLPGTSGSYAGKRTFGFIGLSENDASRDVSYTVNRAEAILTRKR